MRHNNKYEIKFKNRHFCQYVNNLTKISRKIINKILCLQLYYIIILIRVIILLFSFNIMSNLTKSLLALGIGFGIGLSPLRNSKLADFLIVISGG